MITRAGLTACVDEGRWSFMRGEAVDAGEWSTASTTDEAKEHVAAMNIAHAYGWHLAKAEQGEKAHGSDGTGDGRSGKGDRRPDEDDQRT